MTVETAKKLLDKILQETSQLPHIQIDRDWLVEIRKELEDE